MQVKEVAFTSYPATDVAKLRDFYQDALGLAFANQYEEEGVLKYAETLLKDGCFVVLAREWVGDGKANSVTFEVEDIEMAKSELESKGVKVGDIHDTPVCRISHAFDPEGNTFGLHQRTAHNHG